MKSVLFVTAVCSSLALGMIGCSSSDSGGPASSGGTTAGTGGGDAGDNQVELFSWWVNPGEAEALQSLFDLNKSMYPDSHIFNAAADSGDQARTVLANRLAANMPPDLFQENAFNIPPFLQTNPGGLEPLDGLFDDLGLRNVIIPEVISDVTSGGHIYSMPVDLTRENMLLYNKSIFAAHNLQPPTTLPELIQVCDALKAAGVTPFAASFQGWIVRMMFESVGPASMGIQNYKDYFSGANTNQEAAMRAAIDVLGNILDNYVDATTASDPMFGWTNAAQAVYQGKAAMFMHGDWAKAYLVQLGWTPGVDFGVSGAAGASDLFLYGVDVFAMPTGAPHPDQAKQFLGTVASSAGQLSFNKLKGSSPIRLDVPRDQLDPLAQATLSDLENAKIRMLMPSRGAWDDAFGAFAMDKDKDKLYQAFVSNPPGTSAAQ